MRHIGVAKIVKVIFYKLSFNFTFILNFMVGA